MKFIKLFEEYNVNSLEEGMMSEIDIIGQEATTKDEFKNDVKRFLAGNAANKTVADDDRFIEDLASMYFDEDGHKLSA